MDNNELNNSDFNHERHHNDEDCTMCKAYEMFTTLKQLNFDDESAFHIATKQIMDITVEMIFGIKDESGETTDYPSDMLEYLNGITGEELSLADAEETAYMTGTSQGYEEAIEDIYIIIKAYKDSIYKVDDE